MNDKVDTDLVMQESPGAVLRAAREAANISVEAMAEQLNWLQSYVVAIEEDHYSAFSNQTFAKGYLKSYARRLGIEEQGLLENYKKLVGIQDADSQETVETNIPTLHKNGIGKYVGLIVFLLVIAALWMARSGEKATQSKTAISKAISDISVAEEQVIAAERNLPGEDADNSLSEVVESPIRDREDTALQLPAALVENNQSLEMEELEELEKEVAEVADQLQEDFEYSDSEVGEASTAGPGEETLYFSFSDECWLEVKDANGEVIYADLRRAGDEINISGLPPFQILAGQAAAVELRYQNELVPLKADSGRNSVRRRIGE